MAWVSCASRTNGHVGLYGAVRKTTGQAIMGFEEAGCKASLKSSLLRKINRMTVCVVYCFMCLIWRWVPLPEFNPVLVKCIALRFHKWEMLSVSVI